jgi:hypothetical protein
VYVDCQKRIAWRRLWHATVAVDAWGLKLGELGLDRWAPLAWLVVSLFLAVVVTRWFSRRVASLVMLLTGSQAATLYIHFVVFVPGTLLHELSHWLAAKVLGLRTGRLELGPKVKRGGVVQMGALTYQRSDAVRESLVGLAPLINGSIAVLLLTYRRFGLTPPTALSLTDLPGILRSTWESQDAWIWLYLLLSIGNTMFPSASDRQSWGTLALYIALIVGVLYFAGFLPEVSPTVVGWLSQWARELAFVFGLTILFDVILGSILWLVTALAGPLLGRQVG